MGLFLEPGKTVRTIVERPIPVNDPDDESVTVKALKPFLEQLVRSPAMEDAREIDATVNAVSRDVVRVEAAARQGGGTRGKVSKIKEEKNPSKPRTPFVVLAVLILGAAFVGGFALEGSTVHTKSRDVLFGIVQVGFPGLLAVLGIETTKNG